MSDEIDLVDLAKDIWASKQWVIGTTIIGFLISFTYAILAPKIYTSTVQLIPTDPPPTSQLGAAAALFGKKGTTSADAELFQSLISSRAVLTEFLNFRLKNQNDTGKNRVEPLWMILGTDTSDAVARMMAIQSLQKSIIVSTDKNSTTGLTEISVSAKQPWLAKEMANQIVAMAQEEIMKIRMNRTNVIIARLEAASNSAYSNWSAAAINLTKYMEANRAISNPQFSEQKDRLELDKMIQQQSLLQARQALLAATYDQERATNPMVIIDPANLPAKKSAPKRAIIILLGTVASSIFGCCVGFLVTARKNYATNPPPNNFA